MEPEISPGLPGPVDGHRIATGTRLVTSCHRNQILSWQMEAANWALGCQSPAQNSDGEKADRCRIATGPRHLGNAFELGSWASRLMQKCTWGLACQSPLQNLDT
ncbi:aphrodisin-like protein [Cricetulus griseus]|uniref:Aphrodisin-like protein n=1 Tax=Cricetulus griseus TaxID=10029 RepID=A0A061HZE3_CRIGR|nr:aphrodisin-like protein [Cricetulus griseus]